MSLTREQISDIGAHIYRSRYGLTHIESICHADNVLDTIEDSDLIGVETEEDVHTLFYDFDIAYWD